MIDNGVVVTHVQWFWPDEGLWCYAELDGERWAARHVEVRVHDRTFLAAASLAEVLEARDAGGLAAVSAYEHRYGVLPEAPFPTTTTGDQPPIEPIAADTFERLWREGRRARDGLHGQPPG